VIIYQLDPAILAFDQRGTAFHPITAVVIRNAAKLPDRCAVDVAAQDRIDRELLRITNDLFLESADETDRVLNSLFGESAKWPLTTAMKLLDLEQIAHDIERLAFVFAQEIEQRARVRATRAQMHVRNPRISHATDGI